MNIRHYQAYKDSGVEWLGEIPEYWTLSRIKEKGSVRGRVGWKALKADEYVDEGYIFLSTPNIKEKDIDFENVNYITYERYIESPEIMLQEEDILLTKDGSTLGTTNIVTSLPREATVNSSIAVLRFKKQVFKKYLYYQILSDFIQNKISLKKSGMGVPHLFQRDINNFFILIPPIVEQKAIAHYLDTKTGQIDRKIDILTQKASLYGNLKQSLINETVTRGLDKSVPMKDSGIEWIGEIPEHWGIKRLKEVIVGSLAYGANETATDSNPQHPRFIRITDFSENEELRDETFKSLPPDIAQKYLLREGDILFARSGATVGKTFHFKNYQGKACYAGYLIKARPKPTILSSNFLSYYTKSSFYSNWKSQIFIKATIENISAEKYGFFLFIPTPPLFEQKAITNYLDTKTAQIDKIIQTINTQIEKLKELRKTLINDVVTGKIKVV